MRVEEKQKRTELQSVQELLRDWRHWKRQWKPNLGAPSAVPYINQMRPIFDSYTEGEDYDRLIDAATMRAVDMAVERDLTLPQRTAVLLVYLNEIGPAVFRSNRMPMEQARFLCHQAELALIPALRRRDVRL